MYGRLQRFLLIWSAFIIHYITLIIIYEADHDMENRLAEMCVICRSKVEADYVNWGFIMLDIMRKPNPMIVLLDISCNLIKA